MDIKKKFIELTSFTYPYGYENELIPFLPKGFSIDEDGNYFYEVGSDNTTIFACHLDTACKNYTNVIHVFDGKFIRTNKKSILGADDKAGMTIMLYMIENNVPGLYYFFVGEEVGCIGSTSASRRIDFFSRFTKIISFDRRGVGSIITHQSSKRTCSDAFADDLSKQFSKFNLNLEKDDTGIYTDSAEFAGIIPECTNISVGYYKEHTVEEHQDVEFLEKLAKACVRIDWESLSIERDPNSVEYKSYDYSEYYYYGGDRSYSNTANSGKSWKSGYYPSGGYYGDGGNKSTRRGNKKRKKKNMTFDDFFYGEKVVDKTPDYYYVGGKKVYYNDLDNEITNNDNYLIKDDRHNTDYYRGVRKMYLDDSLSKEEMQIVKDQCLDMDSEQDRDFAKYMDRLSSNFVDINDLVF